MLASWLRACIAIDYSRSLEVQLFAGGAVSDSPFLSLASHQLPDAIVKEKTLPGMECSSSLRGCLLRMGSPEQPYSAQHVDQSKRRTFFL